MKSKLVSIIAGLGIMANSSAAAFAAEAGGKAVFEKSWAPTIVAARLNTLLIKHRQISAGSEPARQAMPGKKCEE